MSRYSQRVEALENNEKKKKLIFTLIIAVLVLLFSGGMVLGAVNILNTEGTQDPNAVTASQPLDIDITAQQFIGTFAAACREMAVPDAVRLSVYTDVEVPDDSIRAGSGNADIETQLKYIKPGLLKSVKEYYGFYEGKFGEDFSEKVHPADFDTQSITDVSCIRGRLNDKGELESFDTLFYSAAFTAQALAGGEDSDAGVSTGQGVGDSIRQRFLTDVAAIASDASLELQRKDFRITFETDSKTGRIKNAWFIRGYAATLTITFKGDLKALGTQVITFDFYAKESHWYTPAQLTLSEDILYIKKRETRAIQAHKTADDEVTVSWSSSHPELVSVDDMGYVKGKVVSDNPVQITAVF